MRPYQFTLLAFCLALLLPAGCKTDPAARRELALMRSEILDLEDQYYALRSRHEQVLRELAECRGVSPESLKTDLAPDWTEGEILYVDPGYGDILIEEPIDSSPAGPEVEIRESTPPERQNGNRPASDTNLGASDIEEIFIHPAFTESRNVDDQPGDDGIAMLIQPRSKNGVPIPLAGDLTIKLVDPAATPGQDQVGAWQFKASETVLFQTPADAPARGFALNLPWEKNFPRHANLVLSVQYRTADGRSLKSSRTLLINPPDQDYAPDAERVAAWAQETPGVGDRPQPSGQSARARPEAGSPDRSPRWRPVR